MLGQYRVVLSNNLRGISDKNLNEMLIKMQLLIKMQILSPPSTTKQRCHGGKVQNSTAVLPQCNDINTLNAHYEQLNLKTIL